MSAHYKAFIVVIGITMIVFFLAKPFIVEFMTEVDFKRRRNVWLILVTAAFVVPNYWAYVLIAIVTLVVAVKRDPNPAAFYLFLILAIPPFESDIPTLGLINQVFPLNHLRLMSLAVLLPLAISMLPSSGPPGLQRADPRIRTGMLASDVLILLYCGLQFALWLPYDTLIASVRRMLLFGIDIILPYFVLSRACYHWRMVREALAAFALAAMILSGIAMFETARHWLLYTTLSEHWGSLGEIQYLMRGSSLRAQATGGHSIVLGYALAMAIGFWFALRTSSGSTKWRWLSIAMLIAGLAATLARGPMVGAVVVVLLFQFLGPNASTRALKFAFIAAAIGMLVLVSPWGESVVDRLPFVGSDTEGSVAYRQQLAEVSWRLVRQNPLFGSLTFMQSMEELRQGEGIIDLVNAYAGIALSFGLVGLGLFGSFFVAAVLSSYLPSRRWMTSDPERSATGRALVACVLGGLLTISTVGLYLSVAYLTWGLAGLAVGYARLARAEPQAGLGR
jgi:hypothetical protein